MTDLRPKFDTQAINRAIDAALATAPDGARGAALAVAEPDGSLRVAVATRAGKHWDFALTAAKDPGEPIEGAVAVRATW